MKRTFTTLVGTGAVAATFLFGGSAVLDSTPTAHAEPKGTVAPKGTFDACTAGGGDMKSCCAKVGGAYLEEWIRVPDPKYPGQTVQAIHRRCTYTEQGRVIVDSSTEPGGTRSPIVKPGEGSIHS